MLIGVGFALGKLPGIKGFTAGKGNMNAVYKSGLTKLRNDTASKMSLNVAKKGAYSVVVGSLAMDLYYGVKQYSYDPIKSIIFR